MTQQKSTKNGIENYAANMSHVAISDRLLRRNEVEKITALSRSSIYAMIAAGAFPKPLKISTRTVRWSYMEIADWITGKFSARQRGSHLHM